MRVLWVIITNTLGECIRRRVFIVIPIITTVFLGLYALGNYYAFKSTSGAIAQGPGVLVDADVLTAATLAGLSIFVTLFLASVIGVFLTLSTIQGDAEQGLLQPIAARSVSRSVILLGRLLGTLLVCVPYALFLYGASILITRLIGGWSPDPLLLPAFDLIGAVVVVTAISLFGSIFLSTITNGIVVFMIYGAGLLAGLLGQIGSVLSLPTLETVGKVASWALPFEALYQAGLYSLTSSTTGLTRVVVQLGPLGGAQEGGPLLGAWWALYLLVLAVLARVALEARDL